MNFALKLIAALVTSLFSMYTVQSIRATVNEICIETAFMATVIIHFVYMSWPRFYMLAC